MDEQLAAHILASLGRVEGSLSTLVGQVAAHEPRITGLEKDVDSLTRDVDVLQRSRWKLAGVFAAASFVVVLFATATPFLLSR